MSSNYSANQYESSFRTHRHNNWCETKHFKQRPQAKTGNTTIIANDRGHLLPGVVKRGSAWPDFKGTWDLPSRIPACHINPTGRSVEGLSRLKSWGFYPQNTGRSQPHSCSKKSERLQDVSKQTNRDVQQDCVAPASTAEACPASQNCPVAGGESTTDQNQDSQAAVVGSVFQSDEDKQTAQAARSERPVSQCSAVEEMPGAGEGTVSQPQTGRGRPVSNV
ncbi:protein Flattop isoform X1 [Hippoglossus stenolepis]|uniref:protein Flattop isoform X1 n=1 Tax=Hippoglossus stenolepis TaxID=195615 RepID=UPI00159CA1AE|nr:protein Flattop isoform X1 [Hippoglossus stenolepis]